jgi:hypothetical protein
MPIVLGQILSMVSRPIVLILNPLSGSGMRQPTVRRTAWARQIDVREVRG